MTLLDQSSFLSFFLGEYEKAAKLCALARRALAGRFITSNECLDGEGVRSALALPLSLD